MAPDLAQVPALSHSSPETLPSSPSSKEDPTKLVFDQQSSDYEKALSPPSQEDGDDTLYVNNEPVVQNGRDVSRYVVDLRDDGDQALTFRSIVVGTVLAGLGSALYQVITESLVYAAWLTVSPDL